MGWTAILAAGCATPPPAPVEAPRLVITDPQWVRRPSGAEAARVYPQTAAAQGVGGRVSLSCPVRADGGLPFCRVLGETPPEAGFRTAAIRLASAYQMAERTAAGEAVGGAEVRFAITFEPPAGFVPRVLGPDEIEAADLIYLQRPEGYDVARFYPDRATERGIEGFAEASCIVGAEGAPSNCRLLEEAPAGLGFGAATLRAFGLMRIAPQTRSGVATAGKSVRLRFIWRLAE